MATITHRRSRSNRIGIGTLAGALTVMAALAITIVVAVAIARSTEPVTAPAVEAPALTQMDDYYFRHNEAVPAAPELGPMDDWWFRQQGVAPAAPELTQTDDYYFRHTDRSP
jgi:cytochrome c oxidase assembly factor CtaG